MDDRGRFPGRMKFAGEGMKPNALEEPGIEKSSAFHQWQTTNARHDSRIPFISLFMMIPVSGTMIWLPNSKLTVLIDETARPVWSAEAM